MPKPQRGGGFQKDAMLRKDKHSTLGKQGKSLFCIHGQDREASRCGCTKGSPASDVWRGSFQIRTKGYGLGNGWGMPEKKFRVGDLVLVMVKQGGSGFGRPIRAWKWICQSRRPNTNKDNLRKCHRQGKYTGIITEVYKGTYFFMRLDIGDVQWHIVAT